MPNSYRRALQTPRLLNLLTPLSAFSSHLPTLAYVAFALLGRCYAKMPHFAKHKLWGWIEWQERGLNLAFSVTMDKGSWVRISNPWKHSILLNFWWHEQTRSPETSRGQSQVANINYSPAIPQFWCQKKPFQEYSQCFPRISIESSAFSCCWSNLPQVWEQGTYRRSAILQVISVLFMKKTLSCLTT